jgi:hypothetical protein
MGSRISNWGLQNTTWQSGKMDLYKAPHLALAQAAVQLAATKLHDKPHITATFIGI